MDMIRKNSEVVVRKKPEIRASLERIEVECEPRFEVAQIDLDGPNGSWSETFGPMESRQAFMRGVEAATALLGGFLVDDTQSWPGGHPEPVAPATASLGKDLAEVINKHSLENDSNTPDYILGEFMEACMDALGEAVRKRDAWHNRGRGE